MTKTRVLVIEDSLTVRRRLVQALRADPACEVVGEAEDGARGIALCESLRPDVVTLDLILKNGTGVEVTEHIMAFCPTPIVIVSASFNRRDVIKTYDALRAGALEVIEKPTGDEPDEDWSRRFVETVKLAAKIRVITHPRAKLKSNPALPPAPPPSPLRARTPERSPERIPERSPARIPAAPSPTSLAETGMSPSIIAIGASTGGPGALVQILRELPETFPLSVLLVIHIGQPFGRAFADWLDGMVPLPVLEAKHGEPLPPPGAGRILMAPPERHLVVRAGRLWLDDGPERHSCKPSVDALFESVAAEIGRTAIGCLLTGMGKDGALGLLAMKRAGSTTLVQDESTSVVFGMPREAIRLGAASRILPVGDFGRTLLALGRPVRGGNV
ncbi:chemotaxis-specific protein-glutamate methyltransferase CheB [Polyangium sorediatum]|uniref:Protein-glutamate methylesterase/protein-glutamine glutaminase n=1 Tax=Polyangium sorediatum TaxID=889274 RepID=A0ABT6NJA1_9BACT|nr:chemotaxis-specific protein-glutamate methyltransferase CheB [Polyangium sorediatum]MDI1428327.1 chemotaxis-specific protein-glutamate methyltransferase CheB [Polyangium sorediatum]